MRRQWLARTSQIWRSIAAWHRRSKSPHETGQRPGVPRHTFQIAAPGWPDPIRWIDDSNMGPPSARRKRANIAQMRPAADPIPGPAIPARLVNPVGFDKIRPGDVQRPLRMAGLIRGRFAACAAIARFSKDGFATRSVAPPKWRQEPNFGECRAHCIHYPTLQRRVASRGPIRANIAMILANAPVPQISLMGVAIDYGHANNARWLMQAASTRPR